MTYGLAIDPNTNRSGLCLFRDDRVVWSMTVKGKDWMQTNNQIFEAVQHQERLHGRMAWVAIEDCYLGPNARTFKLLAMQLGALWAYFADYVPYIYVIPASVGPVLGTVDGLLDLHYAVSGRKAATEAYCRMVFPRFAFKTEHEYDAACIGAAAVGLYNRDAKIEESE